MPGVKRQRTNGASRSHASDGTKALSLVRKMASQREMKAHVATGTVSTIDDVEALTLIAEGSEGVQRDGLSVIGKFIEFSGSMRATDADASLSKFVHVGIVVDKQQVAGTIPSWTSIWSSDPRHGVLLDFENHKRFKVLYNRTFVLNLNSTATLETGEGMDPNVIGYNHNTIMFKKRIPLSALPIRWQGASGSDIQKNGVYLTFTFINEEGSTGASAQVAMAFNSRLWYQDP